MASNQQPTARPKVGLFRVKNQYVYSTITRQVDDANIIETNYKSVLLYAEDGSPMAMILKDTNEHIYLVRYDKNLSEHAGFAIFRCFHHFDYDEFHEDLNNLQNYKRALFVIRCDNKYGLFGVRIMKDGSVEAVKYVPFEYDSKEEVERAYLEKKHWDMSEPSPFKWVDRIFYLKRALDDDNRLTNCIKDLFAGEYEPLPEHFPVESSAEEICQEMKNNEDIRNEILRDYKSTTIFMAALVDVSGPDGGPSEAIRAAFFKEFEHEVDELFQKVDDDYDDYEEDDPMADQIEGTGVERHISYYIADRLVDIKMHVFEDGLHLYWDEQSIDGGSMEQIIVNNPTRLMEVLQVTEEEDIIDALMEQCKSGYGPLDMRLFFRFLATHQLEYKQKQVGIHEVDWEDEEPVSRFVITHGGDID